MQTYSHLEYYKKTYSILAYDEQEKDVTMDNQQVSRNNIKNHPVYTRYSADTDGNVYGIRGNLLSLCNDTMGYPSFRVHDKISSKTNQAVTTRAHRFIWECHNGVITGNKVINHIDGDKTNNSLRNLELITQKENMQHAIALGLQVVPRGEDSPKATITEKTAKSIIRAIMGNKLDTVIAREHSVNCSVVTHIRNKDCWEHLFELEEFKNYIPRSSNHVREQYIEVNKFNILKDALCTTETPANIAKRYGMSNGTISKIRNLKASTWVEPTRKFISETSETIPKGSRTKWFEKVSTLLEGDDIVRSHMKV